MRLQDRAALIDGFTPNTRGHDKKRPRFLSVMNPHKAGSDTDDFGHQKKSWQVYTMYDKIRALCNSPERFPNLGFIATETPTQKHGGQYIQIRRSDSREALDAVAQYFIAYLCPISMKVGVRGGKKDKSFLTLELERALKHTGLTYDSFNNAVNVMVDLGMVHRQRCWVDKDDGSHGGRPSIYTLTDKFFEEFGIVDDLKQWAGWVYDKAKKAAKGSLEQIASELATNFGFNASRAPAAPSSGTHKPEKGTLAYYQHKLPKSKHGAFQYNVAIIAQDNPDLPKMPIYQKAYEVTLKAS